MTMGVFSLRNAQVFVAACTIVFKGCILASLVYVMLCSDKHACPPFNYQMFCNATTAALDQLQLDSPCAPVLDILCVSFLCWASLGILASILSFFVRCHDSPFWLIPWEVTVVVDIGLFSCIFTVIYLSEVHMVLGMMSSAALICLLCVVLGSCLFCLFLSILLYRKLEDQQSLEDVPADGFYPDYSQPLWTRTSLSDRGRRESQL